MAEGPESKAPPESPPGRKSRVTRALTVGGVVVSFVAGAIGLLFTVRPDLKPCLGDTDVAFTNAPVFPRSSYVAFQIRNGVPRAEAEAEGDARGAVVSFSYRESGMRGKEIMLTSSLRAVDRDGTLGPVVASQDRDVEGTFTPDQCSQSGGQDVFVPRPERPDGDPRGRYQVVLELFRDERLTERLALTQTAVFRF